MKKFKKLFMATIMAMVFLVGAVNGVTVLQAVDDVALVSNEEKSNAKEKIIEVVVPATWHPIDEQGNVRENMWPIVTDPYMVVPGYETHSEVATLNEDTREYDISFIGKIFWDGGYLSANQATTQIFFIDNFHRIVAQGNSVHTSPIKRAVYGTNNYNVNYMMEEIEYQEGENLHLYIDSLETSISSADFVEDSLLVEYESDHQVLDEIYGNIESIETYNLYDFPNKVTWGNDNSENPYRTAKDLLFIYKYDEFGGGEFINEGEEYRNFYEGGFADLEFGEYEVILPTHWKTLGKWNDQYYAGATLKGEELFSRLRFTQDDTVHFTMNLVGVEEFEVKFVDEDGIVLDTQTLEYGTTPAYDGETPTKDATGKFTYAFAGWNPEIADVTGDATYTATYRETINSYEVKFVDEDGTVLDTQTLEYGTTPAYDGETPTKDATGKFTYTFAGWDPEIVDVTGDAKYTATYQVIPITDSTDPIAPADPVKPNETTEVPHTGVSSGIGLYTSTLFVSLSGLFITIKRKGKKHSS